MSASTQSQNLTESQLRLALPADPSYVRVARTAARGLGERLGMPPQAVEDLALAVDETLVLLLQPRNPEQPRDPEQPDPLDQPAEVITFVFTVSPESLGVETRPAEGRSHGPVDPDALERFLALVEPVVDELAVDAAAPAVLLRKDR